VVDSGGHHAGAVRKFAQVRAHRRVWAIFGSKDQDNVPIWPKKPTRSKKKGVVYRVGVNEGKTKAYGRLRLNTPGPGFVHFSMERGEGYFKQLTAERRRTRYRKGRPYHYWHKAAHARNEAWDLLVYAYAALHALYSLGQRFDQVKARNEAWATQLETGQKPRPRRVDGPEKEGRTKRSGYLKSRRSHWRR
jgi:phage terminase large subunit GpA-like protein